jgi:Phosphotransferase enzyme family
MTGNERRRLAVTSAVEVIDRYGLSAPAPLVLKDSNNTIVWLRPLPVVAKVATSTLPGRAAGLAVELDVLAYLTGSGAPVAQLADGLPPELHTAGGRSVLLLDYVEHDPGRPVPPETARAALVSVHDALRGYPGELPAFTDHLTRIRPLLSDPRLTPDLVDDDRALLVSMVDHFAVAFPLNAAWRPLHGDPWMGGNLLSTPTGAVLVDFEAACRGPVEWDWTSLPLDVTPADLDGDFAARLRLLRSLVVTAWCFAQPGRAPEVDSAARYHLGVVRTASRSCQ